MLPGRYRGGDTHDHHYLAFSRASHCELQARLSSLGPVSPVAFMTNINNQRCSNEGSAAHASFGIKGEIQQMPCTQHDVEGIVNMDTKSCSRAGCPEKALYGVNGTVEEFCIQHTCEGMVRVKHPVGSDRSGEPFAQHLNDGTVDQNNDMCSYKGCSMSACYGAQINRKADACMMHAVEGMVDVCRKMCSVDECVEQASYSVEGTRNIEVCDKHAEARMVPVDDGGHSNEGRSTFPICDVMDTKKRKFYAKHVDERAVSLRMNTCCEVKCSKQATYRAHGSDKALYCKQHKAQRMIHTRTKICSSKACSKRASFGVQGTKVAKFCSQHAETGMVNVGRRPCAYDGCSARPSYATIVSETPVMCARHALPGMVNVRYPLKRKEACAQYPSNYMTNVHANKDSGVDGCSNYPADCGQGIRSHESDPHHAARGTISSWSRKCMRRGCLSPAFFGFQDATVPDFCLKHAFTGMIDMRSEASLPATTIASGIHACNSTGSRVSAVANATLSTGAPSTSLCTTTKPSWATATARTFPPTAAPSTGTCTTTGSRVTAAASAMGTTVDPGSAHLYTTTANTVPIDLPPSPEDAFVHAFWSYLAMHCRALKPPQIRSAALAPHGTGIEQQIVDGIEKQNAPSAHESRKGTSDSYTRRGAVKCGEAFIGATPRTPAPQQSTPGSSMAAFPWAGVAVREEIEVEVGVSPLGVPLAVRSAAMSGLFATKTMKP